jgi:hypothetical protein
VGRRDHRAQAVATGGLEGDHRRGHHTEAVDDDALAGETGDERRFEHGGRQAGVAADDGFGAAEDAGGGAPEVERERRGQVDVGDAPDAVGPELHGRPASTIGARRISAS